MAGAGVAVMAARGLKRCAVGREMGDRGADCSVGDGDSIAPPPSSPLAASVGLRSALPASQPLSSCAAAL